MCSSRISKGSDSEPAPARRPVSRRACLSCREKKIKCDGEPVSKISTIDGGSKVIPRSTTVCSNCKFLGLECVFVQSNRGGRRKKRTSAFDENVITDKSEPKKFKPQNPESQNYHNPPEKNPNSIHTSSISEAHTTTFPRAPPTYQNQSIPTVDSSQNRPENAPSTTVYPPYNYYHPSYGYYNPNPSIMYQGPWNSSSIPHPPGPGTVGPMGHPPLPPLSVHSAPFPDSFGHFPLGRNGWEYRNAPYGHPHHPPNFPGSLATYSVLPPNPYSPPSRPPQHAIDYSAILTNTNLAGPSSISRTKNDEEEKHKEPVDNNKPEKRDEAENKLPVNNEQAVQETHKDNVKEMPESQDTDTKDVVVKETQDKDKGISDTHETKESKVLNPQSSNIKSTTSSSFDSEGLSDAGTDSTSASSRSDRSETPPARLSGLVYHDEQLAVFDLPPWKTLDQLIDIYYIYCQPIHQILPAKFRLYSRLLIGADAAVIHLIIGIVCMMQGKESVPEFENIPKDESYWISLVFKHWDALNGLGVMICNSLLAKTSMYMFNIPKLICLSRHIWRMTLEENYLNTFSYPLSMSLINNYKDTDDGEIPLGAFALTSTQFCERTILIKLIWNFLIHHIILVSYYRGFPYELPALAKLEIDSQFGDLLLPLDNFHHLSLKKCSKTMSWDSLYSSECSDFNSNILSTRHFSALLTRLAHSDKNFNFDEYPGEVKGILDEFKYKDVDHKNKLIIINASYLFTHFIINTGLVLNYSRPIASILAFQFHHPNKKVHTVIQDFSNSDVLSSETLKDSLQKVGDEAWYCLGQLTKSVSRFAKLISVNKDESDKNTESYRIVVGPTALNVGSVASDGRAWNYDGLESGIRDTWLKYPYFALKTTCEIVFVINSILVLTRNVTFDNDNKSTIVKVRGTEKTVSSPFVTKELAESFTPSALLEKRSLLLQFIKVRSQYIAQDMVNDMNTKLDKANQICQELMENSVKQETTNI